MEQMKALIDSFGREQTYLRVSVTDRCNLRCHYCMPSQGVRCRSRDDILSFEEITRLVRVFAKLGISKVRLTGGEPLVRHNLERLVSNISSVPGIEAVGMTTNGVLLERYAAGLKQAGLNLLNISLDSLLPERFAGITLRNEYHRVRRGLDAALTTGIRPIKLNTVVIRGVNDDELLDFVELTRDNPVSVRFIEFMPFRDNRWSIENFVSSQQMRQVIGQKYRLADPHNGKSDGSVAREYSIEGHAGTVGFISPLSDHFCGGCIRLRLTSDGFLKTCLYSGAQTDLRRILRSRQTSDVELTEAILQAVDAKAYKHPPSDELAGSKSQNMVEIGG